MFLLCKNSRLGGLTPPPNNPALKEKSPIARPRKTASDKRSAALNIRITAAERASIQVKAERAGITATEFARKAALSKPVKVEQSTLPDFITRNELRRIGVNLNQIAHALNSHRPHDGAKLNDIARKLDTLFDRWLEHDSTYRQGRPQL